MNLGQSFIIFGVLENFLWISIEFTNLWVFSKWFNQNLLEFEIVTQIPYLKSKAWIKFIQIPSLNRIWMDSNLNQIWIEFYLNNPKEKGKIYCFSCCTGSPQPQRPTGPRPSTLAHSGGLQLAHGTRSTVNTAKCGKCTQRGAEFYGMV
jgi:hypothetical protein